MNEYPRISFFKIDNNKLNNMVQKDLIKFHAKTQKSNQKVKTMWNLIYNMALLFMNY